MGKIALGVCSSISIYKSCDIIRRFQRRGYQVQVVMTQNAARLISPLLFSALTGNKALVDPFGEETSDKISHIDLSKEVFLLLVAPATANILGKFAAGIADDFLSTFYMAVKCPVLIAPAMNENMFMHRQTQQNIEKLKACGVRFVDPEKGYLACKEEGWGRLASPEKIVTEALNWVERSKSLKGKTVLVTAGPTREFLDPVRFLSNRSSGKMGFELAQEAINRGAEVILIHGPTHVNPPLKARVKAVQTSQEMEDEVNENFGGADVVIMAAAVSDIKFAVRVSEKIKKQELAGQVKIVQTPDILKKIGQKKKEKILVGFAAETENVKNNALKKIKQKNLDLIVANNVGEEGIGFESDFNRVSIVFPDGKMIQTERKSKLEISQIIFDEIEDLLGKKS